MRCVLKCASVWENEKIIDKYPVIGEYNPVIDYPYNKMLKVIKYEKRYVNEKSLNIELRNRFRLTDEQINFIRK